MNDSDDVLMIIPKGVLVEAMVGSPVFRVSRTAIYGAAWELLTRKAEDLRRQYQFLFGKGHDRMAGQALDKAEEFEKIAEKIWEKIRMMDLEQRS